MIREGDLALGKQKICVFPVTRPILIFFAPNLIVCIAFEDKMP